MLIEAEVKSLMRSILRGNEPVLSAAKKNNRK